MWTSLNIAICGTAIDRMALSPSALQQCGRDADDPYMIAIQQSTDYLSIRDSIYLVNRPLPSILGLVWSGAGWRSTSETSRGLMNRVGARLLTASEADLMLWPAA